MIEKINIKIQLLHENAVIPTQGKKNDTCFDLIAVDVKYNEEYGYYEYSTGICIQPPKEYATRIYPRSSIREKDLFLCNHVGNVDTDYINVITCCFKQTKDNPRIYKIGDKIAQIDVFKRLEINFEPVENLEVRGDRMFGGYGHTGD